MIKVSQGYNTEVLPKNKEKFAYIKYIFLTLTKYINLFRGIFSVILDNSCSERFRKIQNRTLVNITKRFCLKTFWAVAISKLDDYTANIY